MNIEDIQSVYFVGAGGIGMSALIRYFLARGKQVAGYDRTPSPLTKQLIAEGARLHYEENPNLIPDDCRRPFPAERDELRLRSEPVRRSKLCRRQSPVSSSGSAHAPETPPESPR